MKRILVLGAIGVLAVVSSRTWIARSPAQSSTGLSWIWLNEGDPLKQAPPGTRYFRRTLSLERFVDEGLLDITATGRFTVWVNGTEVGAGTGPRRVYAIDIKKHLGGGKNVLAVEVEHPEKGPAGLLVHLNYIPNGSTRTALVSDDAWKASAQAAANWKTADFNDGPWSDAKVLAPYAGGPWKGLAWDSGGDSRFAVPPGFRVEMAAKNPNPKDPFSLINLTFDNKGRLLVSKEQGPILLCTQPDKDGVCQKVVPYCSQVTGCQGMCWVDDALLLIGDGPQGTGLYRVRDTKGKDKTDEVKLLVGFKGAGGGRSAMQEHGPHAILHGPDDCLYVVSGNHAWMKVDHLAGNSPLTRWPHGSMGPDQGKPGTTEDVLLPRQNDARGHAADILAPGGTIWRLNLQGKNPALVAAGFRNHYDAAFSPRAELFTFDSDMEWDEGLPWYRAVRVCHVPPGADFMWRTGAANTPNYYIDSLPPIYETGRGSPVGLEFYDHNAYPEKYRGAYFMADWSLGLIHVVFLQRKGASYTAKVERFCSGNPMNITDIVVGPDGALYFTMGGRGSQGGVYRIAYGNSASSSSASSPTAGVEALLSQPQPLAAWSRATLKRLYHELGEHTVSAGLADVARDRSQSAGRRIKALTLMQILRKPADAWLLTDLLKDADAGVRAHAVWLAGVNSYRELGSALLACLQDPDDFVRRRACEALIRGEFQTPAAALWPLLEKDDRFLRTAARLVLQRIPPDQWAPHLWVETNDLTAMEGIVALCKADRAKTYTEPLFRRLEQTAPAGNLQRLLDLLRAVQLALVHTTARPPSVKHLASLCAGLFPHKDQRVNRELAILLTYFARDGETEQPVHGRLLAALEACRGDRAQQIYYFYCLRLLHKGWTREEKNALLDWYDSTKSWTGGASFTPFLENILRDADRIFDAADRLRIVKRAVEFPRAAASLLHAAPPTQLPDPDVLAGLYNSVSHSKLSKDQQADLRDAALDALARSHNDKAQTLLRDIGEKDPAQRDTVARALSKWPSAASWNFLLKSLDSTNPVVIFDVVEALKKISAKPKRDDAGPFRAVLVAARRLDKRNRWKTVELLRLWTDNIGFGAENGECEPELAGWARWFSQTFPKEPALPDVEAHARNESRYHFDELLAFLQKDAAGKSGNVRHGRAAFEKAQCLKCHRFGSEGEGIGPDLTSVSKRFDRRYILESIMDPSKVISDQYRSSVIVTKKGQELMGLVAPQGSRVVVYMSDGTKVVLNRSEIEDRHASLISIMPENLLDPLSKQEIADLFAFLESEPRK